VVEEKRKEHRRWVVMGLRKQVWEVEMAVEFHMELVAAGVGAVDVLHMEAEVVVTGEVERGSALELVVAEMEGVEIGSELGEEAMVGAVNCIRMVEEESCKLVVVGSCKQVVVEEAMVGAVNCIRMVEEESCKLVVVGSGK
jgi:hypothetical protein